MCGVLLKVSGFEKFILFFNLHAYSNVSCLDREGDVLHGFRLRY